MLKRGSKVLTIWSGINLILAFFILTSVVVFRANSPLLVMVFEKSEIASLPPKVIASLNTLTILYNSCSIVVSILVWFLIQKILIAGQKWAFWVLLLVIGFVEVMAWVASAGVGNARWQVNAIQSILICCGYCAGRLRIIPIKKVDQITDPPGRFLILSVGLEPDKLDHSRKVNRPFTAYR